MEASEFVQIPEDENLISYTFSEAFLKKMEKLIKKQQKMYWNLCNAVSKRVALVCMTLVVLITTACSVEEIREPIVNLIKQVYESFIDYSFEGDTRKNIEYEYQLKGLSEDFVQTQYMKEDGFVSTTYENPMGDLIMFTQNVTFASGMSFDNEHGTVSTKTIDGMCVEIYERENVMQALWVFDQYYFYLVYMGDGVDLEQMEKLIENIE